MRTNYQYSVLKKKHIWFLKILYVPKKSKSELGSNNIKIVKLMKVNC